MSIKRTPPQRGVTLIELVMFIVIVSVALVGIVQVMRLTTANSADPVRRKQALMLAEAVLEEVELAKFTYCDPTSPNADSAANTAACNIQENWGQGTGTEPVGPRPYDNVNDYVPCASTPTTPCATVISTDVDGNAFNLSGYNVTVQMAPAVLNNIGAAVTAADTEVLHIWVTVSYDGQNLVLDGYRTRYAPTSP
ncbi:MAG TPA: type II secretion system protein [Telluria sp.]|nr:type II secretion system protein [Telluria sp.]